MGVDDFLSRVVKREEMVTLIRDAHDDAEIVLLLDIPDADDQSTTALRITATSSATLASVNYMLDRAKRWLLRH